jgi:4'-phosphopantetheinyl transferase
MAGDRLDLYVALADAIDSSRALAACQDILSSDEQQRAERFAFERHRRQYILAHGLLRFALSEATPGVAPADWSFTTGRYGRPYVAAPATALHFSLSHTEGCVACVVSTHETVGVDVEKVSPRNAPMDTARRFFSPEEVEALRDLPPDDAIDRFFDYWTLKEAYLKARGFGLSLPLDKFSMRISAAGIAISFQPDITDDPRQWHFTMSLPSAVHRLAIADGSGVANGLPITRHAFRETWLLPSGST